MIRQCPHGVILGTQFCIPCLRDERDDLERENVALIRKLSNTERRLRSALGMLREVERLNVRGALQELEED